MYPGDGLLSLNCPDCHSWGKCGELWGIQKGQIKINE